MKEKIIKSINVYNGKIIDVKRNLIELPNHKLAFREVVKHKSGVCVLPIKDDNIYFVKQYRYGCEEEILELPAGLVEENEDLLLAAKRELQEEIKYDALNYTYIGSFYVSPGFTDEATSIFIAENLISSPKLEDDDEFIEICCYSKTMVKKMMDNHVFKDMKTFLALSYYFMNDSQKLS